MPKENLKLISVRIDPETLDRIEAFVMEHRYWKRNAIINQVLTAVMNDFDERSIYDMTRRNYFPKQEVNAKYEILPPKLNDKP